MRLSIIIEWENVILADADRATALLRTLARQIREIRQEVEVLVLYGDDRIDASELAGHIADAGPEFRLLHAPDHGYYELKNFGADQADGELLLFVDSDLHLHDGWLAAILAPFEDAKVGVVSGHTYLEPQGITGKAFATFWFFPLRHHGEDRLATKRGFFASSVGFRRELFHHYRFQSIPGSTRGACRRLADALHADGVPIYRTTAAQASHPAPHGARHFFIRALAHGRDDVGYARASGIKRTASVGRALTRIPRGVFSVFRRRAAVGLSWPATVPASLMALSYNTLRTAGNVITRMCPGVAAKLWRI